MSSARIGIPILASGYIAGVEELRRLLCCRDLIHIELPLQYFTKLRTFVALVRQYGLRPLDVIDSVLLLLVVCLHVCRFRGSERVFSAKAHSQLCSY